MTFASACLAEVSFLAGWLLDDLSGDAQDFGPNNRDAVKTGTPTQGAVAIMPNVSAATDFPNSAASYFMVPAAAWMAVPSFTYVAWVNADSLTSYRCISSRENTVNANRQWSFYLTGGRLNVYTSADRFAAGDTTLSTGTTYMVVFTYDSSTSELKYYVGAAGTLAQNGATLTSVTLPNNQTATPYDLFLNVSHAANAGLLFPWDGRHNGHAYFSSALSLATLQNLYAEGLHVPDPPGVPTNAAVDPSNTSALFTWDAPATGGAPTRYDVRLNGGTITDNGISESFTQTGLTQHTTYDTPGLEVRACNDDGCSEWVAVSFTTEFDPVETTHYEVTIDGGSSVTVTELCEAFIGLAPGTTHTVCVSACNDECCSEPVCLEVTTSSPPRAWSPCPCGPGWRVEVCNLRTGVVRGVLLPVAMDFQTMLNQFGRGTLTLPVRAVRALDVWPDFTSVYITRENMDPANDDCLFAGIVRQVTGNNGTVSVGMDSIESYLWRRRLQRDLSFSSVGQNQIAAALVAETVANGIPLTSTAQTPGTVRTRDYLEADRAYIGPLLEQFTESLDGPSWRLEHTRTSGVWSTRIVFADSVGDDRDTVLKGDREASDYGLDLNSEDHATWVDGFNQATPPLTSHADDLTIYPEFDADPTFDAPLQVTLDEQTQGYLNLRGDISAVPSFTIPGETIPASGLRIGDTAEFHLDQGFIAFHGRARIHGITYRVAEGQPLTRELALVPTDTAVQSVMNATSTEQCQSCR